MQYLSQSIVIGQSDIGQSLVEAGDRPAIHFLVFAISAVHLDDAGLAPIAVGIRCRAAECLGPIGNEALDMLRMEAVAERMSDYLVGHHPTMPGIGKTPQALVATRCLEDSFHTYMITILGYCS